MDLYKELCAIAGADAVAVNEPMERHTTFRIGGPADWFVTPSRTEEVRGIIELCRQQAVPYYIIGNGSNLLVGDKGYRGVIIQVYRKMSGISTEGERICAQAGALLSKVAAAAYSAGLTGMEFASGIPGTLGGAVRMNAGAYGGEMAQVVDEASVLFPEEGVRRLTGAELDFGYRRSLLTDRPDAVVLSAVFRLTPGDPDAIRASMRELMERRRASQPLEWPSAGSTFKRPEGHFAGTLIDQCGLKGLTVGGAQVSEKHAGFVINRGGATSADVRELMRQIRERVLAETGVRLEPEVKIID